MTTFEELRARVEAEGLTAKGMETLSAAIAAGDVTVNQGRALAGLAPFTFAEQPMPTPNDKPSIQSLVRADLDAREQVGIERYGTPLQPDNGRDALRDAYEEALDLACYLKQAIVERDTRPSYIVLQQPLTQQEAADLEAALNKHLRRGHSGHIVATGR